MTRLAQILALSMMVAPQALACGMYIPEEVHLADVFEMIDTEVVETPATVQTGHSKNIAKADNIEASPVSESVGRLIDLLKTVAPQS